MDALLKLVAELLGEGYDDETRAKLEAAAQTALDSATSTSSDELRATVKRLEAEARKSTKRADKAEASLADASGDADERLAALRSEVDQHKAKVSDLETEAHNRKLRSRFGRALRSAEVPEDRREAALELASLDGVELDDSDDSGLAGATAAIERLKKRYAFLWQATEDGDGKKKSGHGGKRNGSDPGAKPPGHRETSLADQVRAGMIRAYKSRGRNVRALTGE